MATEQQVQDAYEVVQANEIAAITAVAGIAENLTTELQAICDTFPATANRSAARQYLSRVQGAVANVFGFDLANMKAAYGLNETPDAAPQP